MGQYVVDGWRLEKSGHKTVCRIITAGDDAAARKAARKLFEGCAHYGYMLRDSSNNILDKHNA